MPRTLEARPLVEVLAQRLAASGTWVSREQLGAGTGCGPVALEDALADLVIEHKAQYRAEMGYRMAGSELCRAAAKQLQTLGLLRAVCGRQVGSEYRVGVAEAYGCLGLVMYELTMPLADSVEGHLQQVDAVLEFTERGL